jgi:hypothetical protein
MLLGPIKFVIDFLNGEGRFAVREGQRDPLAQYIQMKALAQPGAYVIPPQNVNVENFHNSMPRVLNSPVLRGFLRSNLGKARERAPQHVADFSAYEKAAFIFRKELKQLIDTWIDANGDLEKWAEDNRELSESFARIARTMAPTVGAAPTGAQITIEPSARPGDTPARSARRFAAWLFIQVIVLPGETRARIGRCVHCGRYYLNRRGRRDSRFCPAPRNCGHLYTATQAVMRKAKRERDRKLRLVRRALRSWSPTKGSWKDYLVSKTGLTQAFVTRAFNRELKPLRPREPRTSTGSTKQLKIGKVNESPVKSIRPSAPLKHA